MHPPRTRNGATRCEGAATTRKLLCPPAAQTAASQGQHSLPRSLSHTRNQTRDKTTADAPATRSRRTPRTHQQWKHPATSVRGAFCNGRFMRKHRFQFRLVELRDERVEQDDFSKSSEPGKEGVGVARAFAAVHHIDAARGKICALRQSEQAPAQCSLRQRC